MASYSPAEILAGYCVTGQKKAKAPAARLVVQAVLAGMIIAFGSAVSNMAVHSIDNTSVAKLISGLIFPFGLSILMLLGMELFTGNVMISMSVANRNTTVRAMLRSWLLVYCGNFTGSLFIAAATAFFGHLNASGGALAVYTMKVAVTKVGLPFQNALVSGILCNILVCAGVLCFYSAKDSAGKILSAYLPIAFFVIAGFEHSVANMYYIPSAIFASLNPEYAGLAAASGLDLGSLTWPNFFFRNLLPVTIGNIIGGTLLGFSLWYIHVYSQKTVHATEVEMAIESTSAQPAAVPVIHPGQKVS